jgi:hypothetical protein
MKFTSTPASKFSGIAGEADVLGMAPAGSPLRSMMLASAINTVALMIGQMGIIAFKSYMKDRSRGVSVTDSKYVELDCYVRTSKDARGLAKDAEFWSEVLEKSEKKAKEGA